MDELSIQISGMKARLDGVESAIERLHEYQDELEMQIAALQGQRANGHALPIRSVPTVEPIDAEFVDESESEGRVRRGWPDDPAERKAEYLRRKQVTAAKRRAAAQRKGAKTRWAKMTVKQRKEHLLKMQKGRKAAVKKAA